MNRPQIEAFAFGLGLAGIATFWCGLALFGLTAIFTYVPWLYTTLKLAGGIYLIYLAAKIWRGAGGALPRGHQVQRHGARAFLSGCLINLTNPKSVLFAGSVLLAIFPVDITLAQKLLVLLTLFCIEITFYGAIAIWLGRTATRQAYFNLKRWIDRTAAAVLGAVGLNFLLSRS